MTSEQANKIIDKLEGIEKALKIISNNQEYKQVITSDQGYKLDMNDLDSIK